MAAYECTFDFMGDYHKAIAPNPGIGAFTDGFWLNSDLQFTTGEDCLWWIPPHRICYIKKKTMEQVDVSNS